MPCGTLAVTAKGCALDTETRSRASAATTSSARTPVANGSQMKYDEGCRTNGNPASSWLAMCCRRVASVRFSLSRRVTVPSSIHAHAIALNMPAVFHVVARIARSIRAIHGIGALTKPTRSPVATLLDKPDT